MYLLFPLHFQIRLGTPKRKFQHQPQHNKLPSFFLLSGSQPEALITAQDCELLNCTSQILPLLHAFRLPLEEVLGHLIQKISCCNPVKAGPQSWKREEAILGVLRFH